MVSQRMPEQLDLGSYTFIDFGADDHARAMQIVKGSREPIPIGYTFSHYVVKGSGMGHNLSHANEASEAATSVLSSDFRIEVLAMYVNSAKPFLDDSRLLPRSIFYANTSRGVAFLKGLDVFGRQNIAGELERAILTYSPRK